MPFTFSEFNWRLILLMIMVSAVVAYVGDIVGMRIGKKRISLMGLRPRYTSTIITILTGIGIAAVTLMSAAVTSESVRGALYGQNWLQRELARLSLEARERQEQISDNETKLYVMEFELMQSGRRLEELTTELESAASDLSATRLRLAGAEAQTKKTEAERLTLMGQVKRLAKEHNELESSIAALRRESDLLRSGLTEMKEGRITVFQGELLSQVTIEGGSSGVEIAAALVRLTQQAEEKITLKLKQEGLGDLAAAVVIDKRSNAAALERLARVQGRQVVRLLASSNIVHGQTVVGDLEITGSRLIFPQGTQLYQVKINGGISQEEASDLLYTFLRRINRRAVDEGVLSDPISGAVGNLESIEFYGIADRISETAGEVNITFLAATDIYTEGPVNVKIEMQD